MEQSRKDNMQVINRILSISPVVLFIWRNAPGWPVDFVSTNVEGIVGYSAQEFLDGSILFSDIVHPNDLQRVQGEVSKNSQDIGRSEFSHEPYRIITKEGRVKWFDDRTHIQRDSAGKIQFYEGILVDITVRKLAEQLLTDNQRKLNSMHKNIPGMIYSARADWSVDLISNSEIICGYPESDLLNRKVSWIDIIHPDDKELVFNQGAMFEKQPSSIIQEYRIIAKDGSVRYVSDHKTSKFTPKMDFDGVDGIVFDITRRKNYENELVVAKERAETNERDLQERIKELNGIFRLGLLSEKNENLNSLYNEFVSAIVPDSFRYSDKVFVLLTVNGRKYSNRKNYSPSRDVDHLREKIVVFRKVVGELFVCYTENLPFIEIYEQNLVQTYAQRISNIIERKQMHQNILRAIIETEEKERKRVAQDLHDGLGPILSTIKLFTETYLTSTDQSYKQKIASQLLASINEALDQISVISNNLTPQILFDFGLKTAIKYFIENITKISSKKFSYTFNLKGDVCNEIEITIYRVVTELINNTIKHANADSVVLNVWQEGNSIFLEYSDNGIGFDFSKSIGKKAGMGLFNIQHRVNSFNGEVQFCRVKPRGIRCIIRIPC